LQNENILLKEENALLRQKVFGKRAYRKSHRRGFSECLREEKTL